MSKVAIMTDSNCGIFPEQGKQLGIYVVPMPVIIDEVTYYEGVNITPEEFYKKQAENAAITSSLPSPGDIMDLWEELLKTHDEVVYIPMSSGLSNGCGAATALAAEYKGKVHVVDNHRISVTQAQSVFDAVRMVKDGMSGSEIKEILEREAYDSVIYIAVDTLEYLKRGGRVTAAGAAIGSVLNIKPVLTIQGDKLDAFAKVRGMKAAFKTMVKALKNDLDGKFKELYESGRLQLAIANTQMDEEALESWKEELQKAFPGEEIMYAPLTLSIGCHIGPGGLGIGVVRKRV